jgi:hypothetical protein
MIVTVVNLAAGLGIDEADVAVLLAQLDERDPLPVGFQKSA